jgi:hypothetical protein
MSIGSFREMRNGDNRHGLFPVFSSWSPLGESPFQSVTSGARHWTLFYEPPALALHAFPGRRNAPLQTADMSRKAILYKQNLNLSIRTSFLLE